MLFSSMAPDLVYLIRVQALRHRPRGHHVVHDPLRQSLGDFVQLHELSHVVEHVVVLGRR